MNLRDIPNLSGLDEPPKDADKLAAWLKDFWKDYQNVRTILMQNTSETQRSSTSSSPASASTGLIPGHGLAINDLTKEPWAMMGASYKVGLQLSDGADRGKVNVAFQYLGVGPVIVGNGVSQTLVADLAVAGAGGLDAGNEAADTWYYLYVIVNDGMPTATDPTSNNWQTRCQRKATRCAALLSTAAIPTLPNGYNRYRRVGMVRNNAASDLYRFIYSDGLVEWNEDTTGGDFLVLNVTTSATSFTDVSCAKVVPPTCRQIQLAGYLYDTTKGAFMVRNNACPNLVYSIAMSNAAVAGNVGNGEWAGTHFWVGCDSSQIVEYRSDNTQNDVSLQVIAYYDVV